MPIERDGRVAGAERRADVCLSACGAKRQFFRTCHTYFFFCQVNGNSMILPSTETRTIASSHFFSRSKINIPPVSQFGKSVFAFNSTRCKSAPARDAEPFRIAALSFARRRASKSGEVVVAVPVPE